MKKKINQIHESLTHPKVVKFCIISATLVWILGVSLAYLVAQLDTVGPGFDPAGYSFLINYISDFGSLRYTPMPIILNFTMMQTSMLMIPVSFYLKDVLKGNLTLIEAANLLKIGYRQAIRIKKKVQQQGFDGVRRKPKEKRRNKQKKIG